MTRFFSLIALTTMLVATQVAALDPLVGKDDKTGKVLSDVEIYEQGRKVFGKITGLAEPNDARASRRSAPSARGGTRTSRSWAWSLSRT